MIIPLQQPKGNVPFILYLVRFCSSKKKKKKKKKTKGESPRVPLTLPAGGERHKVADAWAE